MCTLLIMQITSFAWSHLPLNLQATAQFPNDRKRQPKLGEGTQACDRGEVGRSKRAAEMQHENETHQGCSVTHAHAAQHTHLPVLHVYVRP